MNLFASFFRRKSLKALSQLDDRQLSDLGLSRLDLIDAAQSANAGELLASRRHERATAWLN